MPARSADRAAHRNFPLPRCASGQKQVRDIGASNQQNESDRAEQQPQIPFQLLVEPIISYRFDADVPAFFRYALAACRQSLVNQIQFGLRLRRRDSRLKATKDVSPMRIASPRI